MPPPVSSPTLRSPSPLDPSRLASPARPAEAVCSDERPRQRQAFAEYKWHDLPEDSFANQGTGVRTAIIVIDG